MNEKLLGLVVSSTVYWLLTQFPLGRSTALPYELQLNILPYLIENALELVLQLDSQPDCSSGLDWSISNEHLTITYLLESMAIPLRFLLALLLFFIAPTEVYHILCSTLFSNVRLIKANLNDNG